MLNLILHCIRINTVVVFILCNKDSITKISVIFTFSLSPQRILQPYVDAVFESIFAVPQGRSLPKAIKCLFDFLDLQASDLGVQDPEILHTWKTNRYHMTGVDITRISSLLEKSNFKNIKCILVSTCI